MNLQHLKYAVEVEKTGSISQAAETLFMNQPNLSKAIKELESSLGISIFRRSPKGVTATAEGAEFLGQARSILSRLEELESHYAAGGAQKQTLRISVPRSSYIADAFTAFVDSLDREKGMDLTFSEVGTLQAVKNILEEGHHLGIIRYRIQEESYFLRFLEDRGLTCRELWEFDSLVLLSRDHPLAGRKGLTAADLEPCIEIAHGDLAIPNLPRERGESHPTRRIYVRERGSQFDLLSRIPQTYMWVSPMPADLLERNRLVQRPCPTPGMRQKDVIIAPRGHQPGPMEQRFLQLVEQSRQQVARNLPQ